MTRALATYLDDHLAGSFAAELAARHCLRPSTPPHVAQGLRRFVDELRQERQELMRVQRALGTSPSALKKVAGRVTGVLTSAGSREGFVRFTPFTLFLELESLGIGVHGKTSMWLTLVELQRELPVLRGFDFAGLISQARRQRLMLERFRRQVALDAFAEEAPDAAGVPDVH